MHTRQKKCSILSAEWSIFLLPESFIHYFSLEQKSFQTFNIVFLNLFLWVINRYKVWWIKKSTPLLQKRFWTENAFENVLFDYRQTQKKISSLKFNKEIECKPTLKSKIKYSFSRGSKASIIYISLSITRKL